MFILSTGNPKHVATWKVNVLLHYRFGYDLNFKYPAILFILYSHFAQNYQIIPRWTCSLKLSKRKIWNKIHMKRKSISFIGKFVRYRDIDEHNMFRQTCESTFSEHMKMRFLEWLKCRQWAALHFQMLKQFQCTCKHQWVESNLSGANL